MDEGIIGLASMSSLDLPDDNLPYTAVVFLVCLVGGSMDSKMEFLGGITPEMSRLEKSLIR